MNESRVHDPQFTNPTTRASQRPHQSTPTGIHDDPHSSGDSARRNVGVYDRPERRSTAVSSPVLITVLILLALIIAAFFLF